MSLASARSGQPAVPDSPLMFLGALGAGGLAVSFFMYLMWMTPHKGQPIPSFDTLATALSTGGPILSALIALALAGIAVFAVLHVVLLAKAFAGHARFKAASGFAAFRASNAETQLLAIPLALAMTVNVGFIVGAVFVPGLWSIREVLFPLALLAFLAVGVHAMRVYLDFLARVLARGGFDCAKNNSLGQMLAVFAFAMIGVGFSAAAAMSHVTAVVVIGFVLSTFFIAAAVVLGLIMLILGFRAMFEHAAAEDTTPTLWIVIPFLTVVGIALYRLRMSLAHNFEVEVTAGGIFAFLVALFAIQVLFGLIGWAVMRRVGYFETYVFGDKRSPGSYALVCPGVALFVFGNFVVHAGLVKLGVVTLFSPVWFALMAPLVVVQIATIWLFARLVGKLVWPRPTPTATLAPAE